MKKGTAEAILAEGIEALYERLGSHKTIKFLQLIGAATGDSVEELRRKTASMSRGEVLKLIAETRKAKKATWKKLGLI